MSAVASSADELELRSHLSRLNALLVLSMLMTEEPDEEKIVRMGASAAPSFAPCTLVGVSIRDGESTCWYPGDDHLPEPDALDLLPSHGGGVRVPGRARAWAYTLGAFGTSLGHLVVAAHEEVGEHEQFLLRVLAQQVGAAIRNARSITFERTAAAELASVNDRLEATVVALRQRIDIHGRLTRVAVSREGVDGIARAVHEVTGRTVTIEDRFGNLRAWVGEGPAPAEMKVPPDEREKLLRRLLRKGTPQWEAGRLVQAVSPRPDSIALLALDDPERSAGDEDLAALEYGATILSLELARLRSMADTEVRLRRDLVEDLLAGTNLDSALERGETFAHDLSRPHSVVVFDGGPVVRDDDLFFSAVRRAAREAALGSLVVTRGGSIVLITAEEPDWQAVRSEVLRELGSGRCRIGIGGRTSSIEGYVASYREARLSLNLIREDTASVQVAAFDQLGVYRLLSSTEDPGGVERFVQEWLGTLLDHDRARHSELVLTLSTYLECGGHYDETAAALSVHRSTLKYRLQRIRQISGLRLGEPDVDFNLQLACRAWRTIRALRGAEPADSAGAARASRTAPLT